MELRAAGNDRPGKAMRLLLCSRKLDEPSLIVSARWSEKKTSTHAHVYNTLKKQREPNSATLSLVFVELGDRRNERKDPCQSEFWTVTECRSVMGTCGEE